MFPLRACCFLFFAALAAYAASLCVANARFAPVRTMSDNLVMQRRVTAISVHEIATSSLMDVAITSCRGDLIRQAMNVKLHDLDQINQVADYEAWAKAHAETQRFLNAAIRCVPMDGNLWIREAMVSRAIAEDAEALKRTLDMSAQLSPFDRQQVLARISVWKRLSEHALEVNNSAARSDIMAILRYGTNTTIAAMLDGAPEAFRNLVSTDLASIDPDRRIVIAPFLKDISQ